MTARTLGSHHFPTGQSNAKKEVVIRARCEASLKSQLADYLAIHPEFRSEGDLLRHMAEFYMEHHPIKNFCPVEVGLYPSTPQDFTGAPRLQ